MRAAMKIARIGVGQPGRSSARFSRRHVTRKIEMIHMLRLYFCLGTVFIS
jgi:hypothetical protein